VRAAILLMERVAAGARAAGGISVRVEHHLPYAAGIHEGRDRRGRLRRRAGGTHHLTDALATVRPRIGPALAPAVERGPGAVRPALERLGQAVAREAVRLLDARLYSQPIPRTARGRPRWQRTGNLRRDLHTVVSAG
jgi:hypothetical protein